MHPGGIREKKIDLTSHARRGLRRKCHAGRIRRLAVLCRSGAHGNNGLRLARWDRQILTLADEGQAVLLSGPIDANEVAEVNLLGRQQVRQRIYDMAFNGALEVPRTVALVRAFLQEEVAAGIGYPEQELPLGGFQNALLHLAQLDFENPLKLFAPQRMKHHYFVEPDHKFRRKPTALPFSGLTFTLFIKPATSSFLP